MILILATAVITIVAYLLNLNYQYWTKRGVPGPKPLFLFGNLGPSYLRKKNLSEIIRDIYNEFPNAPFVGIFKPITPAIIVRDPELIKDITVRSFKSFHDNEFQFDKDVYPISGRNPFFLRGEEWKTARAHLTPGFTSGKMKSIYPLLEENSKQLVKFIAYQPDMTNGKGYEAKEICKRFTVSNVSSCAFGLEAKAFGDENNDFRQIADRFFQPDSFATVKILLVTLVPFLQKLVSIKFTPNEVEEKLTNIITQTLKYREENNIVRNDFLQFLDQTRKNNTDGTFTDVDVVAHAAGFFADGYESSSVVMSFLLYVLAAHPEAQSKLRAELDRSFNENGNSLPYEVVQSLPYLDAVFNESMRLHPAGGALNKLCTKPYTYVPKQNDVIKKPVVIEPNTPVILSLYGLHRDPKYFEDPDSFIPERFVGSNKDKLTKYTFLPFGEGPRVCLGQRFGTLQIKLGVAYIIKNYHVSVNRKTKEPIEYDPLYFLSLAKGGLWLDFKQIVK